jgi:hypothetical protein
MIAPALSAADGELTLAEVRARFDWARRRGHPAWLWPETEVGAWVAALRSIERVTAGILAGRTGARLDGDATAIGIAGYTSGMGPLLGYWIEQGVVDASTQAAEVLIRHLRHNRARMAWLTAVASEVVERLTAAGVGVMVTKGIHTSHAYFPEPGTRPLSDIDLRISPEEVGEAERVLTGAGYRPVLVQRNPYKCDWAPAASPTVPRSLSLTHERDPFTLDVHASLNRNFFGVSVVRLEALLARSPANIWSPCRAAQVPRQPLLLLLLAAHASEGLHGLSLIRLVELTWVIRRDVERGALDWAEAADAAEEVGALRFAYPALALCERLAPGSVPPEILARFGARATPAMRRILDRVAPATAQRLDRLSIEERFMWAGTPVERARRLAYALWPAPAGRSVGELGRIYARRAWRLAQGRVGR